MQRNGLLPWRTLERWSSTAFLVGTVVFVVVAGLNAIDVLEGAGHTRLPLKQAFISAGWLGGCVGLLGLYPALVERNRWLTRAGALFTVIGILGFTAMGGVSLAVFADILDGGVESYAPVFFPPVLIGSVLTFPLFGIATLRSDVHSGPLGVALFGPTLLFVTNVATPTTPAVVLLVVSGLAVVYLGIGYLLRTESRPVERTKPATEPTTD